MENFEIEPYDRDRRAEFRREEAYIRAKKKVDALKGFYWHLAVYIVINAFLILLVGYYSNQGYFSFGAWSTAIFWGIGLIFHFLGVFGKDLLFGRDWERRKIEEYMERERNSRND